MAIMKVIREEQLFLMKEITMKQNPALTNQLVKSGQETAK